MDNVETSGTMTDSQWGGRRGRECITMALSKEITIHLAHTTKKNLLITVFDATACFDRIIPSILYLSYHKYYNKAKMLFFLAKTLFSHECQPITGYGPSGKNNIHTHDKPHCGLGQ